MILPIEIYGSAILRKKSEELASDSPEVQELIANMYETMYAADGIGLAAPQVGVNLRLIVLDLSPMEEDEPDSDLEGYKKVLINPKITAFEGTKTLFNEGCLSLPGLREDVMRHETIELTYADEHFELHTERFSGIKARVIQHEYDHIEGKLFVDHLSSLKKKLINRRLLSMAKGKYQAEYKTKISK